MSKREKKPKSTARKIVEWVLTGIFAAAFIFVGIGQIDSMVHQKENYGQSLRLGYGSFVVKTDSMEPEIMTNSAVITRKVDGAYLLNALEKGETVDVTFMDVNPYAVKQTRGVRKERPSTSGIEGLTDQTPVTNYPMTHRLRGVTYGSDGSTWFVAAGINTGGFASKEAQYQLFCEEQILGIVVVNSPFLGGFFGFISSPWGLLTLLMVPAMYLVITSVMDIFKAMKEGDEEEQATPDGAPSPSKNDGESLEGLSEKDIARLKQEMLDEMMNGKGE